MFIGQMGVTTLLLFLPMKECFYKGSCDFGCKALFDWGKRIYKCTQFGLVSLLSPLLQGEVGIFGEIVRKS